MSGPQPDGEDRTLFRRDFLLRALRSYGEDDCAELVEAGITVEQIRAIGKRDAELGYAADPARRDGSGYPGDKSLALAAVEVLTGRTELARKRRRSTRRQ